MKFMHGLWLSKENINPVYAVEYAEHEINGNELIVYAPTKHMGARWDVTTHAIMTVTLSSPMPGAIKVDVKHHFGAADCGPHPAVTEDLNTPVSITEDDDYLFYTSGNITARISKAPFKWGIEFIDSSTGKTLTYSNARNLGYMTDTDTGRVYMTDRLELGIGETVYGLGERFVTTVRNGQSVDMWNDDPGTGSEHAYKNVPFYMTNRGYGVYVASTADVSFEVASENVEKVRFSVEGEQLTYYVFNGPEPKDVMKKYTQLMGRPALPPEWSFGMFMSSCYKTDFDENNIIEMVDQMKEANISVGTYHLDFFWSKEYRITNFIWNPDTFKDPDTFVKRLRERGVHLNLWIHPYIPQRAEIFKEAMDNGYFIKRKDGSVWQTDNWQAGMAIVDFTNPAAYRWFQEKCKYLMTHYCDSIAADFGEKIPVKDVVYYDGSDPLKMHNYYSCLYNQCVFEAVEEVAGKNKAFCMFRSGSAGSQKFPAHWGGDPDCTYSSMAASLRAGLSAAVSGFSFWTHDVTGFGGTATPDLYKRWCAYGLLISHTRLHGESKHKLPWLYDDESTEVLSKFSRLKCSLMPYIFGKAAEAHNDGIPVIRPMFFEFPKDGSVKSIETQYMLGDKLLVAPIFNDEGIANYYLPAGKWTNYLNGKVYDGEKWITENHDYFTLPLMVRPNTVLVTGSNDARTDYDYAQSPVIEIYEPEDNMAQTVAIPDADAGVAATVSVEKKGGELLIKADGIKGEYTIFISNRTASCGNASVEVKENGTYITASDSAVSVKIAE